MGELCLLLIYHVYPWNTIMQLSTEGKAGLNPCVCYQFCLMRVIRKQHPLARFDLHTPNPYMPLVNHYREKKRNVSHSFTAKCCFTHEMERFSNVIVGPSDLYYIDFISRFRKFIAHICDSSLLRRNLFNKSSAVTISGSSYKHRPCNLEYKNLKTMLGDLYKGHIWPEAVQRPPKNVRLPRTCSHTGNLLGVSHTQNSSLSVAQLTLGILQDSAIT